VPLGFSPHVFGTAIILAIDVPSTSLKPPYPISDREWIGVPVVDLAEIDTAENNAAEIDQVHEIR